MTTTTGLPTVAAALAETIGDAAPTRWAPAASRSALVPWLPVGADVMSAAMLVGAAQVLLPSPPPLALVALWPVLVALSGGYRAADGPRGVVRPRALLRAAGLAGLVAWSTVAVSPDLLRTSSPGFVRSLLLLVAVAPALSAIVRLVAARLFPGPERRVVLVGDASALRPLLHEADRAASGGRAQFRPVAICVPDEDSVEAAAALVDAWPELTVWQDCDDLVNVVRAHRADGVIVASGAAVGHAELRRWSAWLQDDGTDLFVSSGMRDVAPRRVRLSALGGAQLLRVRPAALTGPGLLAKRVVDRVAATLLLIVFAPVLGVLAILVRRDSPGRAFYTQTRIGRHGRPFTVFKLRTMRMEADTVLAELADANDADRDGVLFKIKHDPRITPLGAMLRKYSLDELPQLINVVRGEMSLVGPRPALPSEVHAYSTDLRRRLVVKPGMTGLWQVSGRSDLSWEETVRLDLQYVDNWSWRLDIKLALLTFGAVIGHTGAY